MWSRSRNVKVRKADLDFWNFSKSLSKSRSAALLFPVDPELKRIRPGADIRRKLLRSSCSTPTTWRAKFVKRSPPK